MVRVGLLPADYKNKAAVVRTLVATDPASLSSIEKVQDTVKAALASVQARKDRLAATIAKIHGTK